MGIALCRGKPPSPKLHPTLWSAADHTHSPQTSSRLPNTQLQLISHPNSSWQGTSQVSCFSWVSLPHTEASCEQGLRNETASTRSTETAVTAMGERNSPGRTQVGSRLNHAHLLKTQVAMPCSARATAALCSHDPELLCTKLQVLHVQLHLSEATASLYSTHFNTYQVFILVTVC